MSTNNMSMGDRPSRRGRSTAADPVIDAVQKEDLVVAEHPCPGRAAQAGETARHRGRSLSIQEWVTQAIAAKLV